MHPGSQWLHGATGGVQGWIVHALMLPCGTGSALAPSLFAVALGRLGSWGRGPCAAWTATPSPSSSLSLCAPAGAPGGAEMLREVLPCSPQPSFPDPGQSQLCSAPRWGHW